jgi:hypothetical protein
MLGAALSAIALRGIAHGVWIDDGWSLLLTDPRPSLGALLRERLLVDVHPPLYNVTLSLLRRSLGGGLMLGRMVNFVALAATFAAVLALARAHPRTRLLTIGTLALVTTSYFLLRFVRDFRAYGCVILASLGLATYLLAYVSDALERKPMPSSRLVRGGTFAGALLLANLHYFGAMLVGLQLSVVGLLMLKRGQSRRALELGAMLGLALLPVVLWLALSIPRLRSVLEGGFWIENEGVIALAKMMVEAAVKLCSNPVAWLLALLGAARLVRAPRSPEAQRELVLAGTFALGPILLVVVTVVIHYQQPILQDRYLAVLAGPLCASICVLALAGLRSAGPLVRSGAIVSLAGVAIAVCGWMARVDPQRHGVRFWDESARLVRTAQRACLEQPVPYAGPWPEGGVASLVTAAQLLASRNGFRVRDEELPRGTLPQTSDRCPVALWLVQLPEGHATDAATLLHNLGFRSNETLTLRDFGATAVLLHAPQQAPQHR